MTGIDAEVLQVQVEVLEDALAWHRSSLQDAEQIELRAVAAEQRARDAGDLARTEQRTQREAIGAVRADIDEIRAVLATLPPQRRPT